MGEREREVGKSGRKMGVRGREVGNTYPPVHPLFVDMVDSTCILTQGRLYIEINHLRKAEPIQLYQILNKRKTLKNFKHVLFIIFLKFEAKFDKLTAKNRKNQFLIY